MEEKNKKNYYVANINDNYIIPYYNDKYLIDYEKDIKYDKLIKELILLWNH